MTDLEGIEVKGFSDVKGLDEELLAIDEAAAAGQDPNEKIDPKKTNAKFIIGPDGKKRPNLENTPPPWSQLRDWNPPHESDIQGLQRYRMAFIRENQLWLQHVF
jgi:hypothetical protein